MAGDDDNGRDETEDVVVIPMTTAEGKQVMLNLADLPEASIVAPSPVDLPSDLSTAERPQLLSAEDPFAKPQRTDVGLLSPFAQQSDHTVAEGAVFEQSEALQTVASGDPALELRTQADAGNQAPIDDAKTAATRLEILQGRMSTPAMPALEAMGSPIPEISMEGEAFGAALDLGGVTQFGDAEAPAFDEDETHTSAHVDDLNLPLKKSRKEPIPVEFFVGGYRAHRRLGEGGMAEVFLAKPPGEGEDVVLKRLQSHLSEDERILRMFRREARIASRLDHPNIVKILDFAEEQGSMFLVMEYLDGADFRDLAYRWWNTARPMPIEPIVELCAHAALGLDYAHRAPTVTGEPGNLVHRDISPENLFLTRQGQVKILDFGIARHTHERDDLTMTGEVKGKVPYMSPEQIVGEPLDARSDLWSLTVVLYWLLTGHRPFDGPNDFMTIKQIMEVEPVPPADVNDLVPRALDDVVLKGLAKDKSARFSRGQQLHDALMALIAPLGDKKVSREQLGGEVADIAMPDVEPAPYHPAAVPFARWPTT
jgi:tRNA A-37 threonylcarbamoyl transferase component Bud32